MAEKTPRGQGSPEVRMKYVQKVKKDSQSEFDSFEQDLGEQKEGIHIID